MRFVLAAALLASSAAANAATTVLDFNETRSRSGDPVLLYDVYEAKGFTMTADECSSSNACFVTTGSSPTSIDRVGSALATMVVPTQVTVARDDYTPFLLNSIDLADYYGNHYGFSPATDTIRFTFNFADGTSRVQNISIANTSGEWVTANTLTFNLAPLTTFAFTNTTGTGAIQFDNITVSDVSAAPVPEASTWALMLAGFGLTGATLRRRRRAAALA